MSKSNRIPALKVNQWLASWDAAQWSSHLPRPAGHFFIASVKLAMLRRLAGVSNRAISDRRSGAHVAGYQRAHQPKRSKSIARYIQFGYPLSNELGLDATNHADLVHPGWLPSAILVNIIPVGETRRRGGRNSSVDPDVAITMDCKDDGVFLCLPDAASSAHFDVPKQSLHPLEIIDGQHRLFSIDGLDEDEIEGYEVPVVFFDGLASAWQAYLFWVINVEPKKINPSLAYDLYPELRNQSWLQSGEGIKVYQEHRSQELTEVLWRHELSPWRDRIELHGQRVEGHVSNAAFIRSLMVSFVRRWGKEERIGGLFGSLNGEGTERVLPWKRSQQAAFLIVCWRHLAEAVNESEAKWVRVLGGKMKPEAAYLNPAFCGGHTLLATDQGSRAILVVFNALSQIAYEDLKLEEWEFESASDAPEDEDVSDAIEEFSTFKRANSFLKAMAKNIVDNIDWRTSSAPQLTPEEKNAQSIYRGSSGYTALQSLCFESLKKSSDEKVSSAAATAATLLKR